MTDIYLGTPSPKQRLFLTDQHRVLLYGGARGGGKTWGVRTKATLNAGYYNGISQLIVRRSYPELISNHINPMKKTLYGIAKYNSSEKTFKFGNGSSITFRFCARDSDLEKFQGMDYDQIFFDEATHLSEYQIKVISACLRGTNDFPKRIYMTCNPGGQGHGYIKRLIDRRFVDGEDPDDYFFIPSRVDDNLALMRMNPEYKKNLEMLPEKLRKAWLEGSFDIFEGQFFEEFVVGDAEQQRNRQWTHVIEPFNVPREWDVFRSYDFGYSRPFSCGWWAVDYAGTYYRILELYGCRPKAPNEGVKWTADEQFRKIREIETQHPQLVGRNIRGVADPAIWDGSKGDSINDTAMRHQIFFTKGDNHRIAGWMQMRYRMQFNEHGEPRMYIFNTCKEFIRTIPTLLYSETNPEDLDTTGEDHIADETRYFCMQHPIRSREPLPDKQPQIVMDPLNQLQTDRKSMIRRV